VTEFLPFWFWLVQGRRISGTHEIKRVLWQKKIRTKICARVHSREINKKEKIMSNILKVLFLLACFPLVGTAQCSQKEISVKQQQAIESAILGVHAKMKQAAEQRDVDALYKYVLEMDKGVIIEDGRIRWTRQEALNSTRQGLQGLKDLSYTYTQKYVTVISPTVALWVGEGTSSATLEDGRQISMPFAETIVFVQKYGQWKVLHAHRSVPNR
jgi:ketosteroid isomerase-like protein